MQVVGTIIKAKNVTKTAKSATVVLKKNAAVKTKKAKS